MIRVYQFQTAPDKLHQVRVQVYFRIIILKYRLLTQRSHVHMLQLLFGFVQQTLSRKKKNFIQYPLLLLVFPPQQTRYLYIIIHIRHSRICIIDKIFIIQHFVNPQFVFQFQCRSPLALQFFYPFFFLQNILSAVCQYRIQSGKQQTHFVTSGIKRSRDDKQ